MKNNSPLTPYVPCSPFCGKKANDCADGDVHLWGPIAAEHARLGMQNLGGFSHFGYKYRASREINDIMAARVRFSSEYGFHGAPMYSTFERYHAGEPVRMGNDILVHHGEDDSYRGIRANRTEHFLHPMEGLDLKDFFLYNALAQGLEYQDLALALRRCSHCSGDLIWMYNDCWPESSWTIIDYFLTRKASYYFLKRAFAFRQFIIRVIDGQVCTTIRNDTPDAISLDYELGYTNFDGSGAWAIRVSGLARKFWMMISWMCP